MFCLHAAATTDLLAGYPAIGDTVFESASLCFSKGMIGSTSLAAITVDAHADNGWSGGPVINSVGRLVGIISSGASATIKWPEAIQRRTCNPFFLSTMLQSSWSEWPGSELSLALLHQRSAQSGRVRIDNHPKTNE